MFFETLNHKTFTKKSLKKKDNVEDNKRVVKELSRRISAISLKENGSFDGEDVGLIFFVFFVECCVSGSRRLAIIWLLRSASIYTTQT